jgi:predicted glycoside hydrolase/deacetylase ChbG (UPF0249 family)
MTAETERSLIVNADDFGLTPGVNAGIARAHEHGILTSASLMVRPVSAPHAVHYAQRDGRLALGLHADLGEWEYRQGEWVQIYEVVDTHDLGAVEREVRAQLERFRELVGRDPTHIDSHQHFHTYDSKHIFRRIADELGVPLRGQSPAVQYRNFYARTRKGGPLGNNFSVEHLLEIIAGLPPGVTELGCHPGLGHDTGSVYETERELEVEILCDPRVRDALARERVQLVSFADIAPNRPDQR